MSLFHVKQDQHQNTVINSLNGQIKVQRRFSDFYFNCTFIEVLDCLKNQSYAPHNMLQ